MSHKTDLENLENGRRVVRNSIFVLLLLTVVKAFGGYITNTVALTGDAAGSFGDLISQVAIFIGLTLSLRPPDKKFKYGYHRVETFMSLLIAVFITVIGYKILTEAIARIQTPAETQFALVGIIASVISIVFSWMAFRVQKKTATQINSTALMVSAIDKRNDAFVSGGVLISVVANSMAIPYVESGMGIIIAIIVLIMGVSATKDAVLYLLDYWDDPEIGRQINRIVSKSDIVTGVSNIRLRRAGTFIFGEAFLEINPFAEMTDVRDEMHRLNQEIKRDIPHLGDFILHIDPPRPQKMRIAIPVSEDKGLQSKFAENLKDPFFFIVLEIFDGKIKKMEPHPEQIFRVTQSAILSLFLKKQKVNILIANNIQALLFFTLRLAHIKVYPHFGNVKDIEHTIKLLLMDM